MSRIAATSKTLSTKPAVVVDPFRSGVPDDVGERGRAAVVEELGATR